MRLTGVAAKEGCLEVVIFAQGLEGQVGVRASKAEVPTQAKRQRAGPDQLGGGKGGDNGDSDRSIPHPPLHFCPAPCLAHRRRLLSSLT